MTEVKTKFINQPENLTKELLEGYTLAYKDKVALVDDYIVVRRNPKPKEKVAVVTLGGAGHEPALSGYVGEGMLDCSVVGDIFAAPGAQRLFQALQMFNRDAGILLVVLNHSGDVLSSNMGCQLAEKSGIKVKSILTHEDISAGIGQPDSEKRGLAGCIALYKIVGAAAEEGKTLDEIIEIGERFNNQMATLAVAMGICTHPQTGALLCDLPDGIMEIGMGQHGEGGGGQKLLISADDTAQQMLSLLQQQIPLQKGDKVLLYINGVGGTTHMELSIVFRKAYKILTEQGIDVVDGKIEEMLTVQEEKGFQMILGKLDQDHIELLKNRKANTPYWTSIGK